MSKTGIPYLDEVLNVTSGCTKISEGCANCWASDLHRRFHGQPYDVNCPIKMHPKRLEEALHWRKPRRAGVCFTSDLFHDQVPDEFIDKVFAVMALTPQHTYMLLTKRPERMRAYLKEAAPRIDQQVLNDCEDRCTGTDAYVLSYRWPLPNVWLGVSAESQARADERIPLLLDTPAAHRWVSLEPMLGPIGISRWLTDRHIYADDPFHYPIPDDRGLDWVVIGGESGPKARPCDLEWIRDVRDQCKAAGTPCYVRQTGSGYASMLSCSLALQGVPKDRWPDSKGEDIVFWPPDLRVREWPKETSDARILH